MDANGTASFLTAACIAILGIVAWMMFSYSKRQEEFKRATLSRLGRLEMALLHLREPEPSRIADTPVPEASFEYVPDRVKILKSYERGESPEAISSSLGIPLGTVRLVIEVSRMAANQITKGHTVAPENPAKAEKQGRPVYSLRSALAFAKLPPVQALESSRETASAQER